MKATEEQKEQIKDFFYMIGECRSDIVLHPVIDKNTNTERLAICLVDRGQNTIYVMGLWFLPNDPLVNRFEFKKDVPFLLTKKGWLQIMKDIYEKTKLFKLWRRV